MLTAKQKIFCNEYLADMNATQAAIRAGYSERSATPLAWKLLQKPHVRAYIQHIQDERSNRTLINADYVVRNLKEIADRCMQGTRRMVYDAGTKSKVQATDDDGNNIWEFDAASAIKALELLGKHLGIFEKDNRQQQNTINVIVQP